MMRRRRARRRARSIVVARIGRKSGCRSRGELNRRRSKARTEVSTMDSTGAASKLARAARPVSIGPAVAHALSSTRATATNTALIMATPVVAADDTPNTQSRQENPYAASSTKPFQVRI